MPESDGADDRWAAEQVEIWIGQAKGGSDDALGKLIEVCRLYLMRVATSDLPGQLRGKVSASDIVQDTFLEAQRDFSSFRGSRKEELLAWLRRILLNNIVNVTKRFQDTGKRRVSREVPLDDEALTRELGAELLAADSTPSQMAIAGEQASLLEKGLGRLPDHFRQVIMLRNREHRSFAEIAVEMGRSQDAVRKLWARAIERLQQELKTLDESP